MAKKICIISTKGGVGKTTLAANLSAALADLNQRVLLIDTDIQQSLSKYYPLVEQAPNGFNEMIQLGFTDDCISTTNVEHLDIIVNNMHEQNMLVWMANYHGTLATALKKLDLLYDVIIIDTQSSKELRGLQEIVIRESDHCISPFSPDRFLAEELSNTIALFNNLEPSQNILVERVIPSLTVLI